MTLATAAFRGTSSETVTEYWCSSNSGELSLASLTVMRTSDQHCHSDLSQSDTRAYRRGKQADIKIFIQLQKEDILDISVLIHAYYLIDRKVNDFIIVTHMSMCVIMCLYDCVCSRQDDKSVV